LVGSAIDALIYDSIDICTKPAGINAGCEDCRFGKDCSRHETPRPNGPQFCDWRAVAGDHDRSPCLYLAKHGSGLIAQLPLCDFSAHVSV
jgi:hypothetical protein